MSILRTFTRPVLGLATAAGLALALGTAPATAQAPLCYSAGYADHCMGIEPSYDDGTCRGDYCSVEFWIDCVDYVYEFHGYPCPGYTTSNWNFTFCSRCD